MLKFLNERKEKKEVKEEGKKKAQKNVNRIESNLKVAACMSGQDHVRGIDGYGVSKALELLRTFPNNGKAMKFIIIRFNQN